VERRSTSINSSFLRSYTKTSDRVNIDETALNGFSAHWAGPAAGSGYGTEMEMGFALSS
jgi:hypothetical protein